MEFENNQNCSVCGTGFYFCGCCMIYSTEAEKAAVWTAKSKGYCSNECWEKDKINV